MDAAAATPSPVATIKADPDYWVTSSPEIVYTDRQAYIRWSGPKADNVSLYYIIDGKEFFIKRARADINYYNWDLPDRPDPEQWYVSVFRYVQIKAVWQKRITNSAGKSTYQNLTTQYSDYFTIAQPGAFMITTTGLPDAYVRENYTYTLRATGGETPYRWSLMSGYSLPAGLSLSSDGRITGTPVSYSPYPHNLRFRAVSGGVDPPDDELDLTLLVWDRSATGTPRPPGPFDYVIETSDYNYSVTIDRPATSSATVHKPISVVWDGGASQSVTLEATGCPGGMIITFSPWTGSPTFESDMIITVSNTVEPGTYPIVIHGRTEMGMERTRNYTVIVTDEATRGDLILERPYDLSAGRYDASKAIAPIQVFSTSDFLIKGKNTIFKATISSTFDTDMDVRVELWLPTEDWEWEGVPYGSSSDIRTESMGTYRMQEHYIYNRTVTVPANGEVEVFLPEPSGLVEETIHSSSHMYMDDMSIVTNAPKPRHSGGADYFDEPEYTVIVDPGNRITESNELNNCPYSGREYMQTYASGSLDMLISPVISDNYEVDDFWPGGVSGDAFEDDFRDNIRPQARNGSEFMLGVYPVADDKFSYYLSPGVMIFHERGGDSNHFYMQRDMSDMAAENGYDRIVGLVPDGFGDSGWDDGEWLGVVFGHNPRASFVVIDRNLTMVMVHENYHNLGYDDVYGGGPVYASDAYWVNRQQSWTVSHDGLRDYMEYVIGSYSLGYSDIDQPYWTSAGRYETVMRDLRDVADPEVLLFRCLVYENGSVDMDPFMIVDGKPDVEPAGWNYKIVLKDSGGRVVREQKVNVSFTVSVATAQGNTGGTMPYDKAFISSTIPWSDDVALVELQDKDGTVVASRAVSRNPPVVEFTSPGPGDVWEHGKSYKLKWAASDPDGDTLNFSLALSTDKSAWIPVAIDVSSNEFEFDTGSVQPGDYYFRVRATDGVLSANDTMEQSIRITGESSLDGTATPTTAPGQATGEGGGLPGNTLLIGGVIAIVLIVAVIGAVMFLRPKK